MKIKLAVILLAIFFTVLHIHINLSFASDCKGKNVIIDNSGNMYLVALCDVEQFDMTPDEGKYSPSISDSVEGYPTNAELLITNDGRWIVSGQVGGELPLSITGNNVSLVEGVPPRILLFNKN